MQREHIGYHGNQHRHTLHSKRVTGQFISLIVIVTLINSGAECRAKATGFAGRNDPLFGFGEI
jgi:hypothetical protein